MTRFLFFMYITMRLLETAEAWGLMRLTFTPYWTGTSELESPTVGWQQHQQDNTWPFPLEEEHCGPDCEECPIPDDFKLDVEEGLDVLQLLGIERVEPLVKHWE